MVVGAYDISALFLESIKLYPTGSFQKIACCWLLTPSDYIHHMRRQKTKTCFLRVVIKTDISEIPEIHQEVWVTRSLSQAKVTNIDYV